jgi:predicted SAM-dependent methyltransferase
MIDMDEEELNLNIGSGTKCILEGFKNVDFIDDEKIDYVHDLNNPLPFKDKTVDRIYNSHIIEHFWWNDTEKILKDWYRVLKDGGLFEIWTIDMDKVFYHYMNDPIEQTEGSMRGINWRIFSKKEPRGNAHHSCFNKRYLSLLLTKVGFKNIQVIDPNDYPFRPVHEGINLGLRAVK